jgi:4-hydroxy-4-methyl-2-oxoglutarate aldolase
MEGTSMTNDTLDRSNIRSRLLAVDTSNVADVLDGLGLPDQGLAPAFIPQVATGVRIGGWAFPIQGHLEASVPTGGDPRKMAACDAVEPDTITVWAGAASGVCFFGELIALRMKERGCVGAVCDGGIRDLAWLAQHDFQVYARYRTPVQSIGRWQVDAHNVTVQMPGATVPNVTIAPGDFILGDEDGLLVIPTAVLGTVLEQSERLGAIERDVRAALQGGMTLDEALKAYGHV